MFSKLSLVALFAPLLVSGLQLAIPKNPTSGGEVTISWTNEQGDPDTWSFELTNNAFNRAFAIANNINPSASSLTLTLPIVPVGDGYTLEAVNIGNISDVFAATSDFAIGATTTTTAASSTSASASQSSPSVTGTVTTKASSVTPSVSATGGFSSVIVSQTTPLASNTAASAPATSSTASTVTPINGASSLSLGGSAAFLLSAMAGVAMLAM